MKKLDFEKIKNDYKQQEKYYSELISLEDSYGTIFIHPKNVLNIENEILIVSRIYGHYSRPYMIFHTTKQKFVRQTNQSIIDCEEDNPIHIKINFKSTLELINLLESYVNSQAQEEFTQIDTTIFDKHLVNDTTQTQFFIDVSTQTDSEYGNLSGVYLDYYGQ